MRYFTRSGPTTVLHRRLADRRPGQRVLGPTDADGPSTVACDDDNYEDEARLARQLAADPYYFEVDRHGTPIFAAKGEAPPVPVEEVPVQKGRRGPQEVPEATEVAVADLEAPSPLASEEQPL